MRYREIISEYAVPQTVARQVLDYANDVDQIAFTAMPPSTSGLSRTIWLSEQEDYPYYIVSSKPGEIRQGPRDDGHVFAIDAKCGISDIDDWMTEYREVVQSLNRQDIDFGDLYAAIGIRRLDEMANLRTHETGLPMVVYCSTNGGARHAMRVKVSLDHGDRMKTGRLTSVMVIPKPSIAPGHVPLSSRDEKIVFPWIVKNTDLITKLWNGELTDQEFRAAIVARNIAAR